MKRLRTLVLLLPLVGCNGIQPNPTSPIVEIPALTPTAIRITVLAGELPVGGGSTELLIETVSSGAVAANVPVTLSVDAGELSTGHVTTDRTGHARVRWTGTKQATVTGASGSLTVSTVIPVAQPVVPPPPSPVPPSPRRPRPDPPPPPAPPQLGVTLTADPRQVRVGQQTLLTARVTNLAAGETVLAYQWDWEGTGPFVPDDTSAANFRGHVYTDDGVKNARVLVLTSQGRSTSAATDVFVVSP
jgi:hypothetical protein